MATRIRLGTRGSALALWQARTVQAALCQAHPGLDVELVVLRTQGDRQRDIPLSAFGGIGAFTKELEAALSAGHIDLAVHSMKDVPSVTAPGLVLAAVPERGPVEDALVARTVGALHDLPVGATVATGSMRRRAFLLHLRPDLNVLDLRGNVPTRLRKFDENAWSAMILARAGLERLGFAERIRAVLSPDIMLPAPGQGALYLQTRAGEPTAQRVAALDHPDTHQATEAERAFMARLEGGCRVPIGALATVAAGRIVLTGRVARRDGSEVVGDRMEAALGAGVPTTLGRALAERLLERGAHPILEAET